LGLHNRNKRQGGTIQRRSAAIHRKDKSRHGRRGGTEQNNNRQQPQCGHDRLHGHRRQRQMQNQADNAIRRIMPKRRRRGLPLGMLAGHPLVGLALHLLKVHIVDAARSNAQHGQCRQDADEMPHGNIFWGSSPKIKSEATR
jgi:hypothetical protein